MSNEVPRTTIGGRKTPIGREKEGDGGGGRSDLEKKELLQFQSALAALKCRIELDNAVNGNGASSELSMNALTAAARKATIAATIISNMIFSITDDESRHQTLPAADSESRTLRKMVRAWPNVQNGHGE